MPTRRQGRLASLRKDYLHRGLAQSTLPWLELRKAEMEKLLAPVAA
ncbi:MAG TPA: hypothetical protein VF629_06655 [Hymenobacter sp.]|jgi:hypothetical protein